MYLPADQDCQKPSCKRIVEHPEVLRCQALLVKIDYHIHTLHHERDENRLVVVLGFFCHVSFCALAVDK